MYQVLFICTHLRLSNTTRQSITQHLFYIQWYIYVCVRETCFDLVGHPQTLQDNRSKSCLVFLHCGFQNAYKFQWCTCQGDMFRPSWSPQALQDNRSKSCLVFLHCGIPNAYKFQWCTCQGDRFRPSWSSSGPPR